MSTSILLFSMQLIAMAVALSVPHLSHDGCNLCPEGKERVGAFCFPPCLAGTKRVLFNCQSVCPSNMIDQGIFCRLPDEDRGRNFPWKFLDGFNDAGTIKRCEVEHGVGNCVKQGKTYYRKCKEGSISWGNFCRPPKPDCAALGMISETGKDYTCLKKTTMGKSSPLVC